MVQFFTHSVEHNCRVKQRQQLIAATVDSPWRRGLGRCPTPQWEEVWAVSRSPEILLYFQAQNGEIRCILGAIFYSSST